MDNQNSLRFGKQLPGRNHTDYYALTLFNLVLGGFFGSRLMKNIREDKGLTYGIHSAITPFKTYSIFKISSECNNSLTDVVKTEILNEIKILQTELIGEDELNIAKNYFKGALLRNFDGAFNIADRFKASIESGASKTYYEDLFKQIDAIPAELIRTIANNYFEIESLNYCVAGEK
jgi:predicted Zn-dependent peptidase